MSMTDDPDGLDFVPPVPEFLQARAAELGAAIEIDPDINPDVDLGPYWLMHGPGTPGAGYAIWGLGLPLDGLAEALDCWERELDLYDDPSQLPPRPKDEEEPQDPLDRPFPDDDEYGDRLSPAEHAWADFDPR
jgi:hypothetical protein